MTLTLNLTATFAPHLSGLPWMAQVIDQLDDPMMPAAGLLGVDVGHLDTPGMVVSEAGIGFVARDGRIDATCSRFHHDEAVTFDRIRRLVSSSPVPSRMTHWALCDTTPQINTLVFRAFTLAYSLDCHAPPAARAASLKRRLVIHAAARQLEPNGLSRSIQACLDAFTAAHDDMAGLTLVAPDAEALERFLGAVPA